MEKIVNVNEEMIKEELELTDEQVEEIVSTLHPKTEEETVEDNSGIPYHVLNKGELVKTNVKVSIDPETGMQMVMGVAEDANQKGISLSDVLTGEDEIKLATITEDTCKELGDLGLSEEDTQQLYSIILRYQAKEKFNIYNELPAMVRNMVDNLAMSKSPKVLSEVSKNILEFFINQLHMEQEFIDLQESLKKELEIPGVVDMYAEHLIKSMEVDLIKKADEIEEKDPEKAKQLRHVSKTFTDTYKFTLQRLELDSNPKIVKKINKDLKKFNRHCMEFNYKYQNSKFKITNVSLLVNCLERHLGEDISTDDIKKFVLLFTNICRNMSDKNIIEHTFMYYTIKNILTIEHLQKDNEFYINMINDITDIINRIKEIEKELHWN